MSTICRYWRPRYWSDRAAAEAARDAHGAGEARYIEVAETYVGFVLRKHPILAAHSPLVCCNDGDWRPYNLTLKVA